MPTVPKYIIGHKNPPRVEFRLPGRESYIAWDETEAKQLLNEAMIAMWVFDRPKEVPR